MIFDIPEAPPEGAENTTKPSYKATRFCRWDNSLLSGPFRPLVPLQLAFHPPPLANEVREALEEAFMQLTDNIWRQLSLDFPALAPLFELNDEFRMEPCEVYQLAWENSSWQKMTDLVRHVERRLAQGGRKLLTADAESEGLADAI
ncbi:uncharacterized protein PAC_15458 [Phialocephala subalpina]|uniref:Uncharacterized protein n=1 Tax=Phialocephala subalpina TaxID=576137 RepID=A0A1L7XKL0_9HELO|nr:uncharacterized protein PAC_15458 [Phialocephala subalpina]